MSKYSDIIERSRRIYDKRGIRRVAREITEHVKYQLRSIPTYVSSKYRQFQHNKNYTDPVPQPYEVIWIDPTDVTHTLSSAAMGWSTYGTYVIDGDWDKPIGHSTENIYFFKGDSPRTFDKYGLYISLIEHFEKGAPWEDTTYYKYRKKYLEEDVGHRSLYEIEDEFSKIEELFEKINREGYHTQRDLLSEGDILYSPKNHHPVPEYNEVNICIGRDGTMMQTGNGRHRLSIAKILNIDEIPVRVRARHEIWQQTRQQMFQNNANSKSHADITI